MVRYFYTKVRYLKTGMPHSPPPRLVLLWTTSGGLALDFDFRFIQRLAKDFYAGTLRFAAIASLKLERFPAKIFDLKTFRDSCWLHLGRLV